jgi:hypothetical protein
MKKMKLNSLLIMLMTIGMFACQTNENQDNQNQSSAKQVIEQIKSLPDTILTSKNMNQNEFHADLSEIQIDTKQTSKLSGEWTAQNGEINFLNTSLESGDKVLFYDSVHTSVTGWGTIRYNRAAKFYFTESGSYMYEFYVVNKDRLVLTQYDYRNDDLTMKEKPESIIQELDIEFINDDQVKLSHKGQTIEIKRKILPPTMVKKT